MTHRLKIISFTLVFAIVLTSMVAFAGTGARRGTAGATELLIPVGSRGTALNGSFTSGISGLEAVYWNPAGLALSEHSGEILFSHQNYLADMSVFYVGAGVKAGSVGRFAITFKNFSFGDDIVETTVENPDGTGRTFSPTFLSAGLTYARTITDRITFGLTGRFIFEQIQNVDATGFAFDFGLQYHTGVGGLQLGFALKNFGPRMNFSGNALEQRVQIPGTEAGTRQENLSITAAPFELPSILEIGASYTIKAGERNNFILTGAFHNNSFSFDTYNVGAEYSFNDIVFLRGSYSIANREGLEGKDNGLTSSSEDYLFGPAFGAGVKLNFGQTTTLYLDYAYRTTSVFDGGTQWFTVSFGL